MTDTADIICHRCSCLLTPGGGNFYIVRIDAVCDPTPPSLDELESVENFASEWERLLDEMRSMSERELMDQVHRRMTIHLCATCYRRWIENPTGDAGGAS